MRSKDSLKTLSIAHEDGGTAEPEVTDRLWRGVLSFSSERGVHGSLWNCCDILDALRPDESLAFRFHVGEGGLPARVLVGLTHGPETSLGPTQRLEKILAAGLPGVRFGAVSLAIPPELQWRAIRPAGLDLESDRRALQATRLVNIRPGEAAAPLVVNPVVRSCDVVRALSALSHGTMGALEIDLRLVAIDAAMRRGLAHLKERLAARAYRMAVDDAIGTALGRLSDDLLLRETAVRLEVRIGGDTLVDDFTADLVCLAMFGVRADDREWGQRIDLRTLWPAHGPIPNLLPTTEAMARTVVPPTQFAAPAREPGGLMIGHTSHGAPIMITANDRARHIYLIGATGTGKSTLMLNMLAQDFDGGQGVILLDPHGDLADDTRSLVPARRRHDLIFADATDPDGSFILNILAGQGGDPVLERSLVANAFIRIVSGILNTGIPEAFGPMFELYFRNALLLLMEAGSPTPDLADFESIFLDDRVRADMLTRCHDAKVREFWRGTAVKVTHDEISLHNIAPYITCKLAQFTGNPQMRRILCGVQPGLDLAGAMDDGKIVILKMSKGLMGQSDCELLCAIACLRIAQAGMARAAKPKDQRRPVRIYVDEFQNCAGNSLGDMLAESRKFGISLVLANQSLSQVNGDSRRPDTGAAALANAANLIAFRVGAPDAVRLGPWFAPDVAWSDLTRSPDFHAVARVLNHGRPAPAALIRMAPGP